MAGLLPTEVYRRIKPVDLSPVLAILPSLPFVGVNQGSTDVNKPACRVVLADKFPAELRDFIAGLELGGRTGRLLIRELAPRQGLTPHTDAWMPGEYDWRRFQVPIISHPDIVMAWPDDGVSLHLEPGFLYEVRFDRTHEVIHGADL